MSARAVIDSLDFARSKQELRGEVPVTELERLADGLYDRGGVLRFSLVGYTDGRDRPRLQLTLAGSVNLRCQRCLGCMPFPVALESSLLLLVGASSGEEVEIEDLDAVAADPAFDVWSLVEDEVLLAQPMAPRHAEGACDAAVESGRDRAASPFAVLSGLKR